MAQCEICNDFNEDHIDNENDNSLYESEQYKPNLYLYGSFIVKEGAASSNIATPLSLQIPEIFETSTIFPNPCTIRIALGLYFSIISNKSSKITLPVSSISPNVKS